MPVKSEKSVQSVDRIITENLDQIIDAPGGIKRLRELILQLAVQGKLVPQRPEEGSADELLKQIEEAKRKDAEQRKARGERIRKQKPLPTIGKDEIPFEIPESWAWVRYFAVNTVQSELVSAKDYPEQQQIAPDSIGKGTGQLLANRTVEESGASGPNNRFYKGQLLYSKIRPSLNKVVIAPYDGLCSADMYPIRCYANSEFTLTAMLSEMFLSQVRVAENRVKMPKLNLESLGVFLFPLPPLLEQKRIVAKVDELMAWCDELDALKEKRTALRTAALKATLRELTAATPQKLWSAQARLRFKTSEAPAAEQPAVTPAQTADILKRRQATALQKLITSAADVKQLRDAILQLAVQGRLVEQRESDGTAADLLQQIEAAKAADLQRRKANGERIRKTKPLPPITEEEIPFEIPDNWAWARFGDVISLMDSGWSPNCLKEPTTDESEWGVLKTTAVQELSFQPEHHKALPSHLEPKIEKEIHAGDFLITRAGPTYRVGISCYVRTCRKRLLNSDKIIRCHFFDSTIDGDFMALSFTAGYSRDYLLKKQSGMDQAQVNISQNKLKETPVLLPPLAEQQRIVAKVGELMGWCDELERLLQTESETAKKFAAAIAQA